MNYVLDAVIRGFFDNLDQGWLIKFMEHRVADPRILRLIQKWLNAGVMEEGEWSETKTGTPQGAVISPLLDIFALDNDQTSSLWGKRSGFDPAELDYLIERSKGYYDRRQRDRTLTKGDRVAILGRGIAVVEPVDETEVEALLGTKPY